MSVESELQEILLSLKNTKGIHGSAIIAEYGAVTGSAMPGWVDPESIAAMVTLILKASERATKELNQGKFIRAIIENERGKLMFTQIGKLIIVILTTHEARLGLINLKLDQARKKLAGQNIE